MDLLMESQFLFLFTANLEVLSPQVSLNVSFKDVGKTWILSVLLLHSSSQYRKYCGCITSTGRRHYHLAFAVILPFAPKSSSRLWSHPAWVLTSSSFINVLLESHRSFASILFHIFALSRCEYSMWYIHDTTRTLTRSFRMWRETICSKRLYRFVWMKSSLWMDFDCYWFHLVMMLSKMDLLCCITTCLCLQLLLISFWITSPIY